MLSLSIPPSLAPSLGDPPRYESARAATFSAMAAKAMVVINDKKYYDPAPPYPDTQVRGWSVHVVGLGRREDCVLQRLRSLAMPSLRASS